MQKPYNVLKFFEAFKNFQFSFIPSVFKLINDEGNINTNDENNPLTFT